MSAIRSASLSRSTGETSVRLELVLDGEGKTSVSTGFGMLDHMLTLTAFWGRFDLKLVCTGDMHVDAHHTAEDVALCLGKAFRDALGDRKGIARVGWARVPMDEALARVVLDLSGRPYLVYEVTLPAPMIKDVDARLFREFFQALVNRSGLNLHIDLIRAGEVHHAFEAIFKGFARALDEATSIDPRIQGVMSTKGVL